MKHPLRIEDRRRFTALVFLPPRDPRDPRDLPAAAQEERGLPLPLPTVEAKPE